MSKPARLRLAVLASGNGSNLQAILDAHRLGTLAADPVLVLSDKQNAKALQRARAAKVEARWCDPQAFSSRPAYDAELAKQIDAAGCGLVVLAGYMRLLDKNFVSKFAGRIINIHPSLLPAFPGLEAIRQAWDYGVRYTGCTVHFVDTGMDSGPIILQTAVAITDNETLESLTAKMHLEEHKLLVEAIRLFAGNRLKVHDRRVLILAGS